MRIRIAAKQADAILRKAEKALQDGGPGRPIDLDVLESRIENTKREVIHHCIGLLGKMKDGQLTPTEMRVKMREALAVYSKVRRAQRRIEIKREKEQEEKDKNADRH